MFSYEKIKKWFDEHKTQIVAGVCFVLMFFLGFGVGSYDKQWQKANRKKQSNYNIKPFVETAPSPQPQKQPEALVKPAQAVAGAGSCEVKGNISAKGKKIYHVKGGAFYNLVKPEQCFKTESEARAAGFVKSSR